MSGPYSLYFTAHVQMRLLAPSVQRQAVTPFALPLQERKQQAGGRSHACLHKNEFCCRVQEMVCHSAARGPHVQGLLLTWPMRVL